MPFPVPVFLPEESAKSKFPPCLAKDGRDKDWGTPELFTDL